MTFMSNGKEYGWKTLEEFWWGKEEPLENTTPLNQQDVDALENKLGSPLPTLFKKIMAVAGMMDPAYRHYPLLDAEDKLINFVPFYNVYLIEPDYYENHFLGDFTDDCKRWPTGVLVISEEDMFEHVALDYRDMEGKKEPAVIYVSENKITGVQEDEYIADDSFYIYHLADNFEAFANKLLCDEEINEFIDRSPYREQNRLYRQ